MRAVAVTVLIAAALLAGCSSDEVTGKLNGARSSAAAAVSGSRTACIAAKSDLETVRKLASRIAKQPQLRASLLPQLSAVSKRLSAQVTKSAQLRDVADATSELVAAMKDTNATVVRLAADQAVLTGRATQTACAIVT